MSAKLALITGASSGIGRELARIAAADGYDLIIAADEPMDDLVLELERSGIAVNPVVADLSDPVDVDRVIAATAGRTVDVVCANAGTGTGGPFLDQSFDDWRHAVDTNITGTLYLIQLALRDMTARDAGRVLVTGSIAGYIPGGA